MNVPKDWSEIKLPQFENALIVEKGKYDDPTDLMIDWLAAICDCNREDMELLTLRQLRELNEKLKWIREMKFGKRIPKFFTIKGKLYEVCTDVSKLTAAQYAELCTWMKRDPMLHLAEIMASVTKQRKWLLWSGKYDGFRHKERAELFASHLSLAVIYPIAMFFFQVLSRSLPAIQSYLERRKIKELREMIAMVKEAATTS